MFKFRGTCQGQRPVMAEAKIKKRAYTRCPRSGEELGKEGETKNGHGWYGVLEERGISLHNWVPAAIVPDGHTLSLSYFGRSYCF